MNKADNPLAELRQAEEHAAKIVKAEELSTYILRLTNFLFSSMINVVLTQIYQHLVVFVPIHFWKDDFLIYVLCNRMYIIL